MAEKFKMMMKIKLDTTIKDPIFSEITTNEK